MAIQPTQPQGIGGVLDTAFQLFKSSLGSVWPIALLMAILGLAPFAYLMFIGVPVFDPTATTVPDASVLGKMFIAIAISLIPSTWGMSAMYLKLRAIGIGEELSTGAAFQLALQRLPVLLLTLILYGVAICIGFIALIVPAFILMLSLMLYTPLSLFERKGPVDALVGSHRLVWGNWWRTSAILTVALILGTVIYIAVALVLGLVSPFAGMAVGSALVAGIAVQVITQVAINILAIPFLCAVVIAVYWDLKLRKEGGDLAARVNALSAA